MNRRIALKLLGAVAVGFVGSWVSAETVKDELTLTDSVIHLITGPQDVTFGEEGIRNIIIERKSGKVITIPFSEICDALESN